MMKEKQDISKKNIKLKSLQNGQREILILNKVVMVIKAIYRVEENNDFVMKTREGLLTVWEKVEI